MPRNKLEQTGDREVRAIGTILGALDGLDGESMQRVLDYVFNRLSIAKSVGLSSRGPAIPSGSVLHAPSVSVSTPHLVSIRDLYGEKKPATAIQMAALVAYYLSELATEADRKPEINTADVIKYFKQAGFRLPGAMKNTLPNAAAAGYFDPVGGGLYRLNPVGYNLVVHGMPRSAKAAIGAKRKSSKKAPKPKRSKNHRA